MNVEAEKAWTRIKQKNDVLERVAIVVGDISASVVTCAFDSNNIRNLKEELDNLKSYILWAKGL